MAKLHKFVKRSPGDYVLRKIIGEKTYDDIHPLGTQAVAANDAKKASEKALQAEEDKPVIPLPDEEELARTRRLREARRTGGRSSTVLSDPDQLGG